MPPEGLRAEVYQLTVGVERLQQFARQMLFGAVNAQDERRRKIISGKALPGAIADREERIANARAQLAEMDRCIDDMKSGRLRLVDSHAIHY